MSTTNPTIFDAVIAHLNAACLPEPGCTFQDAADLPEMVVIPGGSFLMGSPESEPGRDKNEGPQHRVEIRSFALGKYPVTQRQWHALMGDNPSYFSSDNIESNADRPVERICWLDARNYIERLSRQSGNYYQLPTEAEWEYACRAGSTTAYPWGDTIKPGDATFNRPDTALGTSSVYGGRPNAFGLHDMIGNVWEIVEDDDSDDYSNAPTDGSAWKDPRFRYGSDDKVTRGGSWDLPAEYLRSACRSWIGLSGEGNELTGFRVAMPMPPADWNTVKRVVRGVVDPDGERLTLIYGDMSAEDWDGGLSVVRIAPPKDGTLVIQFLIETDVPNLSELLNGVYQHIKEVLVRFNILPPWDYARHRGGSFSNVYGDWHWGYMPKLEDRPTEDADL